MKSTNSNATKLLITGRNGLIIDDWLVAECLDELKIEHLCLMHRPSNSVEVCVADSNISDKHGCIWNTDDMGTHEHKTDKQMKAFDSFFKSVDKCLIILDGVHNPEEERLVTALVKHDISYRYFDANHKTDKAPLFFRAGFSGVDKYGHKFKQGDLIHADDKGCTTLVFEASEA